MNISSAHGKYIRKRFFFFRSLRLYISVLKVNMCFNIPEIFIAQCNEPWRVLPRIAEEEGKKNNATHHALNAAAIDVCGRTFHEWPLRQVANCQFFFSLSFFFFFFIAVSTIGRNALQL